MNKMLAVDLFAEDKAHEEFIKAMLLRLARLSDLGIRLAVRSARGGHGRAISEFDTYQTGVLKGIAGLVLPDLVCVAIDANCKSFAAVSKSISQHTKPEFKNRVLIACPDPHIERWYLADPACFFKVVGVRPKVGRRKCERDLYKRVLSDAVRDGSNPSTLGGIEFAEEIVNEMDLYRAGKNEPSLKHFLDSANQLFRQF